MNYENKRQIFTVKSTYIKLRQEFCIIAKQKRELFYKNREGRGHRRIKKRASSNTWQCWANLAKSWWCIVLFVLTMVFFWIEYSVGRFTLNSSNIGAQQCTSRRLNSIFVWLSVSLLPLLLHMFGFSVPPFLRLTTVSFVCMYVCMYMSGSIRAIIV